MTAKKTTGKTVSSRMQGARAVWVAVGILALAYALSTNRKAISLRIVGWGLGLQVLFALIVLVAGKRAVPWFLHRVVHIGSRELFRLAVLATGERPDLRDLHFGPSRDPAADRRAAPG